MRKLLAIATCVLILSAAVGGLTVAWFTSSAESTGNQFTAGTLDIQLGESSMPFNFINMAPGDRKTHTLTVRNAGSLDMQFRALAIGHTTGVAFGVNLDEVIDVIVRNNGNVVYSGTLARMNFEWTPATFPDNPFASLQETVYEFEFTFNEGAGNIYQEATWTGSIVFYADQWSRGVIHPTEQIGGLELWLDASSINANDGERVPVWNDLSENNVVVSQDVEAHQPIFQSNGLNGRPALQFNSTHNYAVTNFAQTGAFTRFVVTQSTYNSAGFFFGGTDNFGPKAGKHQGGFFIRVHTRPPTKEATHPDWHFDNPGIAMMQRDLQNDVYVSFNGGNPEKMITAIPGDAGIEFIGSGRPDAQYYRGFIAEIIVFDRALSQSEIAVVEQYLSAKYGF